MLFRFIYITTVFLLFACSARYIQTQEDHNLTSFSRDNEKAVQLDYFEGHLSIDSGTVQNSGTDADVQPKKIKESTNNFELNEEAIIEIGDKGTTILSKRGGGRHILYLLKEDTIKTKGIVGLRIKNITRRKNPLSYGSQMQCEHVFFLYDGINESDYVIGPSFGDVSHNREIPFGGEYVIVTDIRKGFDKWLELKPGKYKVKICIGGPHICLNKKVNIEYIAGDPVPEKYRDRYSRCEQLCPDQWPNRCSKYQSVNKKNKNKGKLGDGANNLKIRGNWGTEQTT